MVRTLPASVSKRTGSSGLGSLAQRALTGCGARRPDGPRSGRRRHRRARFRAHCRDRRLLRRPTACSSSLVLAATAVRVTMLPAARARTRRAAARSRARVVRRSRRARRRAARSSPGRCRGDPISAVCSPASGPDAAHDAAATDVCPGWSSPRVCQLFAGLARERARRARRLRRAAAGYALGSVAGLAAHPPPRRLETGSRPSRGGWR